MSLFYKIGIFVLASIIVFIAFFLLKKVIYRMCYADCKHYTTLYQDESVEDIISNADQNIIDKKEDTVNKNTISSIARTEKRNTLRFLSNGDREMITTIRDVDTGQVVNQSTRHV
ncbi:hypothetical protein [Ehrlichia muris]|uniref:hypothetical protein n=1 Tax=Ehrlichia muris TaxID=35795 RepID=UPI0037C06C61